MATSTSKIRIEDRRDRNIEKKPATGKQSWFRYRFGLPLHGMSTRKEVFEARSFDIMTSYMIHHAPEHLRKTMLVGCLFGLPLNPSCNIYLPHIVPHSKNYLSIFFFFMAFFYPLPDTKQLSTVLRILYPHTNIFFPCFYLPAEACSLDHNNTAA